MGLDFRRPVTAAHTREGVDESTQKRRSVTIASASLVRPSGGPRRSRPRQAWQDEAWRYRRTVPELGFAIRWLSKGLSRCNLFVGEQIPGTGDAVPVDHAPRLALDVLARLHGGPSGQKEMLRRMAVHLSVPGETWLVGIDPGADGNSSGDDVRWVTASDREWRQSGDSGTLLDPEDGHPIKIDLAAETSGAQVVRLWQPDDEKGWLASSALQSCLDVLGVIEGLHRRIKVDIDSRLAGAGILIVPTSATIPNPRSSEGGDVAPLHEDPFVDALMQGMLLPIQDPDDVSALVPLVVKVPIEAIDKIKHISFATEFDKNLASNLQNELKRFAIGADLPAEIVTGGLAEANHWSGWLIDEVGVKLFVAPLGGTICDALTQQILWPALRAAGERDPERWVIGLDTSELDQRPNKATEAAELHSRGKLADVALLRESGFGPEDMPDDTERQRWLLERLVLAHPQYLPYVAPLLDLPQIRIIEIPEDTPPAIEPSDGDSPDSSRPEIPEQQSGPPALSTSAAAVLRGDEQVVRWMVTAVESAVVRALEVAGKKLLGSGGRGDRHRSAPGRQVPAWNVHTTVPRPIEDADVDRLLAGAWTTLDAVMPDQPCIRVAADTYCRALLMSGKPHSRDGLVEVLQYAGCLTEAA
jgi:hypothetical protein